MTSSISKNDLQKAVNARFKFGNMRKAAEALGISKATLEYRCRRAKTLGLKPAQNVKPLPDEKELSHEEEKTYQQAVDLLALHGTLSGAARAAGMSRQGFTGRLETAERLGFVAQMRGQDDAKQAVPWTPPGKGQIKRYIVTCAQNNTMIHEPTWQAIHALREHYSAELMVSTLTYVHSQGGSAKRGTARKGPQEMWYDPRVEPYVVDDMVELAPNLIWNGHWNILPTAMDPLSSLENYNFRKSSVFPHVKMFMKSIPTTRRDGTKLQYTTGTVTKRNYIQKKAGQKAEFDHVYGGLLVEVNDKGEWWVRQLQVDKRGGLYDLDVHVTPKGEVVPHKGVEALQYGDIHSIQLEPEMMEATWGDGGMVDALKPRHQFMHDLIDFEARSHHNLRDPFVMFDLHTKGRGSVKAEVQNVSEFLKLASRKGCKTVVVQSNHDLHFEKWLRETSWKTDPENALLHSKATTAFLEAIYEGRPFNALKWALDTYAPVKGIEWPDPDEGFILLHDKNGGIEMGLHGDNGPNGARGSLRNLSRLGRKVCIGHSHSAGIFNGAWQSGLKARLDLEYAKGSPSSWTQSDIIVHKNGKRQMVTWWRGKYRA